MTKTNITHNIKRRLKPRLLTKSLLFLFKLVFICGICFTIIYPLIQKFSMSLMDQRDLYDRMVKFIPMNFRLDNYSELMGYMQYWGALANSLMLSTLTAALQTFSCMAAGYGFAKFNFKGKSLLFNCVLVAMIVPSMITITPLFLNFKSFDLFGLLENGKLVGNVFPFVAMSITASAPRCALYIFLARQFFRGVPKELEEAASIDGAGQFKIFFSIMLKTATPIIITIFLFAFVWQYNDTMFTGMFYGTLDTIPKRLSVLGHSFSAAISMEASASAGNIGYISIMQATGTLMAIAPLLILYAFFQKHFVQSVERTGLVG